MFGETISYMVEVTNLTANISFFKNLHETSYVFSPENGDRASGSSCDEFQFRVQAVNAAGSSEFSDAVMKSLPTCELDSNCLFQFHMSPTI